MKILVVTNLFPPHVLGGYEILCEQVVERLAGLGHDVVVLTSVSPDETATAVSRGDRVRVLDRLDLTHPFSGPAPFSRRVRARTGRKNRTVTARTIRECAPDVVFMWSQLRLSPGPSRAAEASGLPVLYSFNDEHPSGYVASSFSPRVREAGRWALDRFVFPGATNRGLALAPSTCISESLRSSLRAGGVPVERCRVLYQGIPIERFPLKSAPGVMGSVPRVMYAGQLHEYKGVHTMIDACHTATRLLGPVQVDVFGIGPDAYVSRLRSLADAGPAEVRFHGKVSQEKLADAYRSHDVLVFPSIWDEPFGLTHLEAMASGTPVISTLNGGPAEFLRHRENALIFPAGDTASLAERLIDLVNDDRLRHGLAVRGRETVERDFTLDRYVDGLESLLFAARSAA
jgi:glycogen(starch) synthase